MGSRYVVNSLPTPANDQAPIDPKAVFAALDRVDEERKSLGELRLRAVLAFEAACKGLDHGHHVEIARRIARSYGRLHPSLGRSWTSLYRWKKRWERYGPLGLIDKRGKANKHRKSGFVPVASHTARALRAELEGLERLGLAVRWGEGWAIWRPWNVVGSGSETPEADLVATWAVLALGREGLRRAVLLHEECAQRDSE